MQPAAKFAQIFQFENNSQSSISQQLARSDQETLIVHSSFALLAFSEAYHTPQRYGDRLAFPNGLQVTRNFSNGIYLEGSGLHRAMVAVINDILVCNHFSIFKLL